MNDRRLAGALAAALDETLRTGKRVWVPAGGDLVWLWFGALCATRTYGIAGPNPISFAEIEAYARLYRWPMEPRHVDLILSLDQAWLDHARGETGTNAGAQSVPPSARQEITPAAFDAVFG